MAIRSLTQKGLVLNRGELEFSGTTNEAVKKYVNINLKPNSSKNKREWGRGVHTKIRKVQLLNYEKIPTAQYKSGESAYLRIEFDTDGQAGMSLEIFLADSFRNRLGMASLYQFHGKSLPSKPGTYEVNLEMQPQWLASGRYSVDVTTSAINVGWDHFVDTAIEFEVPYSNPTNRDYDFKQNYGFGSFAILLNSIHINKH